MTTVMVDAVMWTRAERRSCLYGSFQALGIKVQPEDMSYRNFYVIPRNRHFEITIQIWSVMATLPLLQMLSSAQTGRYSGSKKEAQLGYTVT